MYYTEQICKLSYLFGIIHFLILMTLPQLVARAIGLERTDITLLNPILNLDMGKPEMVKAMLKIGNQLGKSTPICMKAMAKGGVALAKYQEDAEKMGKEILSKIKPDEKVFVLVTRNYGISDSVLSMNIGETLIKMGYQVITLSHLPAHSIDLSADYPNLYWPFSQHILSGAKLIKEHPNLYAIYLTNHGCGPDGMISHLFSEIMGEKPYLSLEVDEHYSKVGVITKLEAFVSSLKSISNEKSYKNQKESLKSATRKMEDSMSNLSFNEKIYLPPFWPYADLVSMGLQLHGYEAAVLPDVNEAVLNKGRSYTRMKEYETFTALMGEVITLEEMEKERHTFLMWQTQGAETDGFYAMLVQDYLRKNGNTKLQVIAPMLETFYQQDKWAKTFMKYIVLGDIILWSRIEDRACLFKTIKEELKETEPTWLEIETYATMAAKMKKNAKTKKAKLQVIGEPGCIFQDSLNNGMLSGLEEKEYELERMMLSEYIISMWEDEIQLTKEKEKLNFYVDKICRIQKILGLETYQNLQLYKEGVLDYMAGGNARYRMAKQKQPEDSIKGKLLISSAYENLTTILNLMISEQKIPSLSLSFDGNPNEDDELRIATFLEIIENT